MTPDDMQPLKELVEEWQRQVTIHQAHNVPVAVGLEAAFRQCAEQLDAAIAMVLKGSNEGTL